MRLGVGTHLDALWLGLLAGARCGMLDAANCATACRQSIQQQVADHLSDCRARLAAQRPRGIQEVEGERVLYCPSCAFGPQQKAKVGAAWPLLHGRG